MISKVLGGGIVFSEPPDCSKCNCAGHCSNEPPLYSSGYNDGNRDYYTNKVEIGI